jgi:hypothetical protein
MLVSCTAYSSALKMETTYPSETSVDFCWTKRRYVAKDRTPRPLWFIVVTSNFVSGHFTENTEMITDRWSFRLLRILACNYNSPPLTEPEISQLYSQQPVVELYFTLVEFSSLPHSLYHETLWIVSLHLNLDFPSDSFLAYYPYFEKLKIGLWNHLPVCVYLYAYPPLH